MTTSARVGTIEAWNAADGVGRVALEDGTSVRIGGSACRGFQAAEGVRVRVLEVAPHPLGGLKAVAVELAEDAATYDARMGSAETEPPETQVAANARTLGWLAVLLPTAPEAGRAGVRALFDRAGLTSLGVRIELGPSRTIGLGRFDFPYYVGRIALFDAVPHRGYIALSGGLVGLERNTRLLRGESAPMPFGPDSTLTALLRITRALAKVGSHVARPVSGGIAPSSLFLEDVAELDDPDRPPTDAILDVVRAEGGYRTRGLALAGLPDVFTRARDHDALLRDAAYAMARANRDLVAGDRITIGDVDCTVAARGDDLVEIAPR